VNIVKVPRPFSETGTALTMSPKCLKNLGGRDRDRTCDPYHVNIGGATFVLGIAGVLRRVSWRQRDQRDQFARATGSVNLFGRGIR
jgi:hypothetical protein